MRSNLLQASSCLKSVLRLHAATPTSSNSDSPMSSHRSSAGRLRIFYAFLGVLFCLGAQNFAHASTYYLSPTGSDSNSGTSANAAWVSPNHSLNCGDVIVATPSTQYSANNFYTGRWGNVNCPAANGVAWLTCAQFDACKITTTNNPGMWVDKSYWGVQGWEVTATTNDTYGSCFTAQPNWSHPVTVHHIIFANDVANGCTQGGFETTNHGTAGVDYIAVLGNIAYNAAQGSASCTSGISIWQPVQSDGNSGTHIYVAGNFSYGNLEPRDCGGTGSTDGEGIIFDTFDGSQGGPAGPYAAQAVAYNNLVMGNGAKGIEVVNNEKGSSHANIYIEQNTSWGDLTDPNQSWMGCGELSIYQASNTHFSGNLTSTKGPTGCGGHPIYPLSVSAGNNSDSISSNFAYGYNGYNEFMYNSGSFSYGSNTMNENANLTNPVVPGAPKCEGTGSVTSCMSSVISDYAPKAGSAAQNFGYHRPSSSSVHDPLFPHWLCTANVPAGLVTMGCS